MTGSDRKSSIRTFLWLSKSPGVSEAEFASYWTAVRPRMSAVLPLGVQLAHSIILPEPVDPSPRLFDALIELWGDGEHVPAVQRALASPGTLYDRFDHFVRSADMVVLNTEENIVQMGPARLERDRILRALWVVRRKPRMSVNAFHEHWRHRHAPLVPRTPSLVRYVQYHVVPRLHELAPARFDGVAELCWNNLTEMRESMQSVQMQEEQFPDMANFLDPERITSGFFREVWRGGKCQDTIY
jgi:uncharacterized protein (TIGR02118 family)